jgi:hypothetical protein
MSYTGFRRQRAFPNEGCIPAFACGWAEEHLPLITVRPIYRTGKTAILQMLHFIYIFLTTTYTEYFKHAAHSPFFLQNAVYFIMLHFLFPVIFTLKCRVC